MKLNQRIKELMKEHCINQQELSEMTGLSKMMVSRIVSGSRDPKDEEIEAIATALGVTVDALISPIEERAQYEPMISRYQNSRMSVEEAARLMGKRPMFVRVALQRKQVPFGFAIKGEGDRYSYYISKRQFEEYTGIKVQ